MCREQAVVEKPANGLLGQVEGQAIGEAEAGRDEGQQRRDKQRARMLCLQINWCRHERLMP